HVVDANPARTDAEIAAEIGTIVAELGRYSAALEALPRWVVLNKLDLLPADEREAHVRRVAKACEFTGPVYGISAQTGEGTEQLARDAMRFLERLREEAASSAEADDASGHGA